jgi:hypothetical protein
MSGELIKCVRKFRNLDDQAKDLNSKLYKIREDRKIVELEMSDILKSAQYATINKLELNDDNSIIRIKRPDTWTKPWSLSTKELKNSLDEFWASGKPKNADECFKYIVDKRKMALIATDFSFTRAQLQQDSDDDAGNV